MQLSDFPKYQHATLMRSVFSPNDDLPQDLIKQLKPCVKAAGLTYIGLSHPYYQIHKQVQKRLLLLQELKDSIRKREGHLASNDFTLGELTYDLQQAIQWHTDYVLSVDSLLDIYNPIDHASTGVVSLTASDGSIVTGSVMDVVRDWREYITDHPRKALLDYFKMPLKQSAPKDKAAIILIEAQMKSRRTTYVQRLKNAVVSAHQSDWYMVFDTLTLENTGIKRFYEDTNAIRDYTRRIGRLVNKSMGRPARDSYSDVYQYFCVPEYGGQNGRLHFHVIHLLKRLPIGSVDCNYGLARPIRRQLDTLKGLWPYGYSMPIAIRYGGDRFGRDGWRHPLDIKTNQAVLLKPVEAVCNYIAKYVSKNTDYKITMKLGKGLEKWQHTTIQQSGNVQDRTFKVRMSRNFGMKMESMDNLSMATLVELTQLHYRVTSIHKIVKENARKMIAFRLGKLTLNNLLDVMPETPNLLKSLRLSMKTTMTLNQQSSMITEVKSLTPMDISSETREFVQVVNARFPSRRFPNTLGTK
ncbi:MAG: replication initiator protein [Microviridae sp.]|nr:MAG: replication initiator protein [Microviridae sp.]